MMMDIHPIKTEIDYDNSLHEIELLWGSPENTLAGEKLDILLVLVEAYENEHYTIDPPDPIEAIKFRMEQSGLTRKDLEPFLGSRGRISEIFSKKRDLSLNMIRKLHNDLHIPLESLIN
ncbi:MAG: helix-turn-helix domain-containing protein [Gammaproteobacteria bacterium]|nr:helix-turn-helix domain-containing protein [Gammaproteobacteria bacterium]